MFDIEEFKIIQNDKEVEEISISENNIGDFTLKFILPTKSIIKSKLIVILTPVAEDKILILHESIHKEFDDKGHIGFELTLNDTLFLGNGLYNLVVCSVPLSAFDDGTLSVMNVINSYNRIFKVVRVVRSQPSNEVAGD